MKNWLIVLFAALLLLSGCSGTELGEEKMNEEELTFPEASFTLDPEEAGVGEAITFTVKVTENNEAVEDADVAFEFWMEGQEEDDHEMIPVDHSKDGIYTLDKSFQQAGKYYMYYHVDARGMHLMDKHEFTVRE